MVVRNVGTANNLFPGLVYIIDNYQQSRFLVMRLVQEHFERF